MTQKTPEMKKGNIHHFPSQVKRSKDSSRTMSEMMDSMEETIINIRRSLNGQGQASQKETTRPSLQILPGGNKYSGPLVLNEQHLLVVKDHSTENNMSEQGEIDPDISIADLIGATARVLESGTDYANTLAINIKAYDQAVCVEKELKGSNKNNEV